MHSCIGGLFGKGLISDFFETGTEGAIWVLERSCFTGYDALVYLQEGDEITIKDSDGIPLYIGVINPDPNIKKTVRLRSGGRN